MENTYPFNWFTYNCLVVLGLCPVIAKKRQFFCNKLVFLLEAGLVCFVPYFFTEAIKFDDKKTLTDYVNYVECKC